MLALPMFHRADLIGLVLIGAKPNTDTYRPDEEEVLAFAVHRIGLDLDALRIEALERETDALRQHVKVLEAREAALGVAGHWAHAPRSTAPSLSATAPATAG